MEAMNKTIKVTQGSVEAATEDAMKKANEAVLNAMKAVQNAAGKGAK